LWLRVVGVVVVATAQVVVQVGLGQAPLSVFLLLEAQILMVCTL
jgi:hypothetical protein